MKWTVDVSRVQPEIREVVRGETVALEATLQCDGKPFATGPEPVCIFWQTNGMGSAWWSVPASVTNHPITQSSNQSILSATFTPEMDPGAPTVNGFLGSSGSMYRAIFTLRFRHGPGATPNLIEQPPRILDLARTVVVNPPWPTQADFYATTEVMREELKGYVDSQIGDAGVVSPQIATNIASGVASNVVTRAYVEALGISAGLTTNDVSSIVDDSLGGTNAVKAAAAAVSSLQSSVSNLSSSVSGLSSSTASHASQLSQLSQDKRDKTDLNVYGFTDWDVEFVGVQPPAGFVEAVRSWAIPYWEPHEYDGGGWQIPDVQWEGEWFYTTHAGWQPDEDGTLTKIEAGFTSGDDINYDCVFSRRASSTVVDKIAKKSEVNAKRDLTDNTCRKSEGFGLWTFDNGTVANPQPYLYVGEDETYWLWQKPDDDEWAADGDASSIELTFIDDDHTHMVRSAVCVSNETFVTPTFVTSAVKVKSVNGETGDVEITPSSIGAAAASDVSALNVGYDRLYRFNTGATNANFTATNYPPTKAEADARCHWRPDPDTDFSDVPSSLQLNEFRDGELRVVFDSRDWPYWYFRNKEKTLTNEIARLKAENAALSNELENARAWAGRTANGVENPMDDTVVVDRPNLWLMAGYDWAKVVSGSNQCFVIRANNVAMSGGASTNGFLEVLDAFGKPYMRINKTAETFADPVFEDIRFDADEGAWYVVFGNKEKPTKGGANVVIRGSYDGTGGVILHGEDEDSCPAVITWPDVPESHANHWIMKAVPKPVNGEIPSAMFFGAEIRMPGRDYVEYLKEASFGAGIRFGANVYDPVESGDQLIWRKRQ